LENERIGKFAGENATSNSELSENGVLVFRITVNNRLQPGERFVTIAHDLAHIAPEKIWLYANRAHALMFVGRTDEARPSLPSALSTKSSNSSVTSANVAEFQKEVPGLAREWIERRRTKLLACYSACNFSAPNHRRASFSSTKRLVRAADLIIEAAKTLVMMDLAIFKAELE
jgi:hypothetical protein